MGIRFECTVLHQAAESMDIEYFQEFYNNAARPMGYLLNAQDANGDTALFRAIRAEKFDNCNFWIGEGADGYFLRIFLKNEMFYNRNWTGVSIREFIDILNEYLVW